MIYHIQKYSWSLDAQNPPKKCLTFETFVRQRGIWPGPIGLNDLECLPFVFCIYRNIIAGEPSRGRSFELPVLNGQQQLPELGDDGLPDQRGEPGLQHQRHHSSTSHQRRPGLCLSGTVLHLKMPLVDVWRSPVMGIVVWGQVDTRVVANILPICQPSASASLCQHPMWIYLESKLYQLSKLMSELQHSLESAIAMNSDIHINVVKCANF